MKTQAGFIEGNESWCHLDFAKTDLCFMQDAVHILTKLRTRFLKPNVVLPMGNHQAGVEHLQKVINLKSNDKHLLTKKDINGEDKMNLLKKCATKKF